MKAVLKITTVIAFMFIAAISTAKEPKLILTAYSEAKVLVLELENVSKETFIEFKDVDNNIIYSENTSKLLYTRKFNVKNLKNGLYYFKTKNYLKTVVYSIQIQGDEIIILEKEEINKPFFRKTVCNVLVSFLNLDKEDVEITVTDDNNRLVFDQKVEDELIVEKSFNFSDAHKGVYTVALRYKGEKYNESFIVD